MLKHPYSSHLDIPHWCWGTEWKKSEWRKGHNGTEIDVGWERDRGKERWRERRLAGQKGWRGPEIKRDAGSCTDSGGNNDMKEPSWRSHTALAHLRRHKISWPLHTHTGTHTDRHACMQTLINAPIHTQTKTHTHTVGNGEHSQRRYNKEKSVTSRTSKHNYHHSSAYTDWPLLPL